MAPHTLNLLALEKRLTPAAAYTAIAVGSTLTLTGTDEDDRLMISDDGLGVTIFGQSGTTINGAPNAVFLQAINTIKVVGKGGNDTVTLDIATPLGLTGGLDIDLGDADTTTGNVINLTSANSIALGKLTVKGGEGRDTFSLFSTNTTVSTDAQLNFGQGDSACTITDATINGKLHVATHNAIAASVVLNGCTVAKDATVTFKNCFNAGSMWSNTTVNGNAVIRGTDGLLLTTFSTTTIKGPTGLTIAAPGGALGEVNVASGFLVVEKGGLTVSSTISLTKLDIASGAGLSVATDCILTVAELEFDVEGSWNARSLTATSTFDMTFNGLANMGPIQFVKNATLTAKSGTLAGEFLGGGFDVDGTLALTADNIVWQWASPGTYSIGATKFSAKTGEIAFTFANGTLLSQGAFTATARTDAQFTIATPNDAIFSGPLSITGNKAELKHNGSGPLTMEQAVTVKGRREASIELVAGQTFMNQAVNVSAATVDGLAQFDLASGASVNVGGPLKISGVQVALRTDSANTGAVFQKNVAVSGRLATEVALGRAACNANVTVAGGALLNGLSLSEVSVGGLLSLTSGGGDDVVILDQVAVTGATSILTGAGADNVTIDGGSDFTGVVTIDTGSGTDRVVLAQETGLPISDVAVQFNNTVTIRTGTGNDTLQLGRSVSNGGDARSRIDFIVPATIDGGSNLNFYDDEAGQLIGAVNLFNLDDPTP